jgi:hypothetical protein
LEVSGGTFEFTEINGTVFIGGNFTVFIGTLLMNVAVGEEAILSNEFIVSGSVDLGAEVGGPTLILEQVTDIPSPTTFNLIICDGTGEGDFFDI